MDDQAPAFDQAREGRRNVAQRGVGDAAFDMMLPAENGGFISTTVGRTAGLEMIVDMRRVEARDRHGRKQLIEQARAGVGELV